MHLLVLRFSAMGDVALTVPVLRGVLEANDQLEILMVSNKNFEPMFHDIERLNFYGINLKNYSGFGGLFRLYKQLKSIGSWDAVIDLHSVMRTWVLDNLFQAARVPVFKIDKGRKEKKALVQHKIDGFYPLKHTTQRYLDVFESFGISGEIKTGAVLHKSLKAETSLQRFLSEKGISKDKKWLGIAPFARHKEKTWPFAKVVALIEEIDKVGDSQIFLLGGADEAEALQNLANLYPRCHNMANVLSLDAEIALAHMLDVVVAMDSFNMHLAALCDTKVVSIWGGTHPFSGFGPLNDNDQFIVQIAHQKLNCRPCSVFGSKQCYRKDWACLEGIEVKDVLKYV